MRSTQSVSSKRSKSRSHPTSLAPSTSVHALGFVPRRLPYIGVTTYLCRATIDPFDRGMIEGCRLACVPVLPAYRTSRAGQRPVTLSLLLAEPYPRTGDGRRDYQQLQPVPERDAVILTDKNQEAQDEVAILIIHKTCSLVGRRSGTNRLMRFSRRLQGDFGCCST
jgi:hypothetical protein